MCTSNTKKYFHKMFYLELFYLQVISKKNDKNDYSKCNYNKTILSSVPFVYHWHHKPKFTIISKVLNWGGLRSGLTAWFKSWINRRS